ncbi:MAG: BrnT family toxin [Candidatus Kapabacteria bacterium]|nr:BrnT family toxin [Candidatus Kapabacteria bacterium]
MFEWHNDKEKQNLEKHNISFAEASSVFDDYFAIYIEDKIHSIYEERLVVIGYSNQNRLITVVFTERDNNQEKVTRIISARKSTIYERKSYEARSKYN